MKLSIKAQLEKNNMSRYELAKRLGMSYQSIHNMYKEESTSVKFSTLEGLCRELSCDLDDILIFDDPTLRQKQLRRNYGCNDNTEDPGGAK